MKGLLYNLLNGLASEAHCAEEAWELVAEFATAETLLRHASIRAIEQPNPTPFDRVGAAYEAPTAAMLTCLLVQRSNDGNSPDLPLLDLELDGWFEGEDYVSLDDCRLSDQDEYEGDDHGDWDDDADGELELDLRWSPEELKH